jgi:hypothetical protein
MLFLRLMTYEIDAQAGAADGLAPKGRFAAFRQACRRLLRRSDDLTVLQSVQARPGTEEPTWSKNASSSVGDDGVSLYEKGADVCPTLLSCFPLPQASR